MCFFANLYRHAMDRADAAAAAVVDNLNSVVAVAAPRCPYMHTMFYFYDYIAHFVVC